MATDTANSIASIVLWGVVLFFSVGASLFIDGLGNEATFYIFATICFIGAFTFCFAMKEIKGMTKEQ